MMLSGDRCDMRQHDPGACEESPLIFKVPFAVFAILMINTIELMGQSVPVFNTREEQLQAAQATKSAVLVPDKPRGAERYFNIAEDTANKLFREYPVHLQHGGLPNGWGFSIGPLTEWRTTLPTGSGFNIGPYAEWRTASDLSFNLAAIGSTNHSYIGAVGMHQYLPGQSLRLSLEGAYVNARRIDFYGEGQDSLESNRSLYRREETSAILRARWQPPRKPIALGAEIGGLFYNVGPASGRFPSTEAEFDPSQAPGIDEQTDFLRSGAYIEIDLRNIPGKPTRGTRAFLGFRRYADVDKERFSFNRLSAAVDHYIPFFNEKRVIALHAGTEVSYHDDDQTVPFYVQSTLGGPYSLRGFGRYRFYDNNALEATAEYRWEVSTGFEWALFADAGRVFDKPSQIDTLSHLKTSAGFGVRFSSRSRLAWRIDTAFSNEGVQTWFQVRAAF